MTTTPPPERDEQEPAEGSRETVDADLGDERSGAPDEPDGSPPDGGSGR